MFKRLPYLSLFLAACSGPVGPPPCGRGPIQPLLQANWQGLSRYEVQDQTNQRQVQERVVLPSLGLSLEILQSGCDTAQLEFRFLVLERPPQLPPSLDALNAAALCADYLGRLYELNQEPRDFLGLAQSLDQAAENLSFDQWTNLPELNCRIKLSQIPDPRNLLLVLKIEF